MPAPSAAAAFRRLRSLASALSHETQAALRDNAPVARWLALIEARAERDLAGEVEAAAKPLLAVTRKVGRLSAVKRAVADVADSLRQLRRFVPFDGPHPADRLDAIRAELRGRFKRLAALLGIDAPGDDLDDAGQQLTPTQAVILAAVVSAPEPVSGWKAVQAATKADGRPRKYPTVREAGAALIDRGLIAWDGEGRLIATGPGRAFLNHISGV